MGGEVTTKGKKRDMWFRDNREFHRLQEETEFGLKKNQRAIENWPKSNKKLPGATRRRI